MPPAASPMALAKRLPRNFSPFASHSVGSKTPPVSDRLAKIPFFGLLTHQEFSLKIGVLGQKHGGGLSHLTSIARTGKALF